MKDTFADVRFFSHRTLWGSLAGIFTALVFIVFFKRADLFTPLLSVIFAVWVSKLSQPKHFAGLALMIGVPAGIAAGIQFAFTFVQVVDLGTLIEAYFNASFFFVIYLLGFVLQAFFYGQILRLYRRGALF